jgi:hypothetical protein
MFFHQLYFPGFNILSEKERFHCIPINRLLGSRIDSPVSNILWFGSHLGVTMYLYTSKHLRNAQTFERLLYR